MEDFTAGTTHSQSSRRQTTLGDAEFDARVRQLVADWGAEKAPELIEEMIVTALKMARDKMGVADLKLMTRSLKEMRYAAKVFAPYSEFRKVVVFGSARIPPGEAEYEVAEEFARKMVAQNYMVVTGGGEGVMGAAQRGAGREHSFGLNIRLPFEQRANETILGDPKLITFNYFFTRKLNFVKETHAFALFPGGRAPAARRLHFHARSAAQINPKVFKLFHRGSLSLTAGWYSSSQPFAFNHVAGWGINSP